MNRQKFQLIKMWCFLIVYIKLAVFNSAYGARELMVDGVRTLFAMHGEKINISCEVDPFATTCGFLRPDDFIPSLISGEIVNGQCIYKVNATYEHVGDWSCFTGHAAESIYVRVTGRVAAVNPYIVAHKGDEVTLSCITPQTPKLVRYCQITPPIGKIAFSVNTHMTKERPFMMRYYLPLDKKLSRGECAVTILNVKYEDTGEWGCTMGLGKSGVFADTIELQVQGYETNSEKVKISIIIGACVAIIVIIGISFAQWNKRRAPPSEEGDYLEMASLEASRLEQTHAASSSRFLMPPTPEVRPRRRSSPSRTAARSPGPSTSRAPRSTIDRTTSITSSFVQRTAKIFGQKKASTESAVPQINVVSPTPVCSPPSTRSGSRELQPWEACTRL